VPKGREFLAWWPEKRAFTQQSTLSNQHDVLGVGNFARGSSMNLASGVLRQKLLVDDMRGLTPLEEARPAKSAWRRTSAALDHFLVLMGSFLGVPATICG
jgi:hypothetical protein